MGVGVGKRFFAVSIAELSKQRKIVKSLNSKTETFRNIRKHVPHKVYSNSKANNYNETQEASHCQY